jgi:Tfp pilus assembly PilM family ATPase
VLLEGDNTLARFLALDWDHQQLHLVAATVTGGSVRIQKVESWSQTNTPNLGQAEEMGRWLRDRLKEKGIAPAPVLACVGRDRVILKDLRYPDVPQSEEAAVIRFQAVKELTEPPDEVIIDYTSAGPPGSGERRALVPIIRRELLQAWQAVCQAAGLKLAALTPRPFGTVACLGRLVGTSVLTPAPEPADAAVAVLTVGEKTAEFCVSRGGYLLLARSLTPGPNLAGEVRRNLAVYAGQSAQQSVRALYVAGEATELRQKLGDVLGIPVYPLDPFALVERPDLPTAGRGGYTAVVGLLHARADRAGLPINFVRVKQVVAARDPKQRLYRLVAALAAAVVIAAFVYGYTTLARLDAEIAAKLEEKKHIDSQATMSEEDDKRFKAVKDWVDTEVVWLDEFYDITDRIPDHKGMRLTQINGQPVPRTAKSKQIATMTVVGVVTNESATRVDTLLDAFVKDGHYRVKPKKMDRNTGPDRRDFPQQFTLSLELEKVAPNQYVRKLAPPPPPEEKGDGDGGEMPGFGGPNFGGGN